MDKFTKSKMDSGSLKKSDTNSVINKANSDGLSALGANLITTFLYPLELIKLRMQSKFFKLSE